MTNLYGEVERSLMYEREGNDDKSMIGEDCGLKVDVNHLQVVNGNHDIYPSA